MMGNEANMVDWPEWWDWDLELSPHLLKRMIDRGFNEADLRLCLSEQWLSWNHLKTDVGDRHSHTGRAWEVIGEPWSDETVLVVITAYPVDKSLCDDETLLSRSDLSARQTSGSLSVLARESGDTSCRTGQEPGLLIDYAADGQAIGIEITSPTRVSVEGINRALAMAKHEPVTATDLSPLLAA